MRASKACIDAGLAQSLVSFAHDTKHIDILNTKHVDIATRCVSYGCMSNTKPITDLSEVFGLFKSNVELAEILKISPSGVSEMKRRRSIPVQYWQDIVAAAAERGENLSLEVMAIVSAKALQKHEREDAA